ncbi:Hypothetical protein PHPALM_20890 [Phytophthora palmivora]|uniref:Uncharacterized protein n=1 Tax=Phytophthora palmivora TaxID=4796 RepID=A0A2P4XDP8_9STRA|nr:Hypothetical protein PHPALM_20890 [Phytophthora palmivora]
MEQGDRHHNEHIQLARLIAFAVTQLPEPSDSAQRDAILHAESASVLVDILRGEYQPPNSSAELAQLRVDLHSTEASNASLSAATSAPSSSSVVALPLSSNSAGIQVPLRHRPPRSIETLRRVRKAKLTPSQRLRVLANPESATAAGPRKRKVALPPLQPYGQPLPREDGYEEAAALIGPPDDRLLAASDSELTVPPARPLPRRRKMAAISTSSSQTSPSAKSIDGAGQEVTPDHDFEDVPDMVDSSPATSTSVALPAESSAVSSRPSTPPLSSLSTSTPPAMAVPSTPSVVVSVVPPVPTPSSGTSLKAPVSLPAQPSSAKSSLPVPSSPIARLLACKGRPGVPSRVVAAPAGLTSPSGRPLRTAAATARQVNAQLLENLGTSDTLALGLEDGSSGAVGTQPGSSGSVLHPLELCSDSADDDQPGAATRRLVLRPLLVMPLSSLLRLLRGFHALLSYLGQRMRVTAVPAVSRTRPMGLLHLS